MLGRKVNFNSEEAKFPLLYALLKAIMCHTFLHLQLFFKETAVVIHIYILFIIRFMKLLSLPL